MSGFGLGLNALAMYSHERARVDRLPPLPTFFFMVGS